MNVLYNLIITFLFIIFIYDSFTFLSPIQVVCKCISGTYVVKNSVLLHCQLHFLFLTQLLFQTIRPSATHSNSWIGLDMTPHLFDYIPELPE